MKLLKKLRSLITGFNAALETGILPTSPSKAVTIKFSGQLTGYGLAVLGNQFYGKLELPVTLDELYQKSQFHSILETTSITSDRGIILPVDIRLSVFNFHSNYSYSLFISSGLTGISAYYDIKEERDVVKDFKIPYWVVQEHNFFGSGFDSILGNLQESEICFHNLLLQIQKKSTVLVSENLKIQDKAVASRGRYR
ncbi:hypothetical protein WA1_46965 [Scytonema hofmannii PCC 7110]|uniref:Uncharacterized protein n=2 Tax=Scytonema hofmannii TaxID=34078 RepID=A0A139WXK4_9CYAN|nr:hypothetical protein WA1_46965 [Scytonema hofmannii PCC 7110]